MIVSGLIADSSDLIHLSRPKLPVRAHRFNGHIPNAVQFVTRRVPTAHFQKSAIKCTHTKCAASLGRNYQELRFNNEPHSDPFWLSLFKEAFWALRSLLVFLAEQPSQLRYIEWPSFQSTLKTATLTLILVVFLIVALSSIDAVLCYVLAWLLQRTT